ncbi:MAG: transcriptional regulator, partial [Myxococcota bacterium]|nr:transcriptional regulator [Myxococcota bacterium]
MKWEMPVLALGVVLVTVGHAWGLFFAPPEAMMGDVGRILYVHVPTAWAALVILTAAFVAAIGALWTSSYGWDAAVEAFSEVGVVLTA